MKVGQYVIELTSENDWGKYFVRRIMKLKTITGIKVINFFGSIKFISHIFRSPLLEPLRSSNTKLGLITLAPQKPPPSWIWLRCCNKSNAKLAMDPSQFTAGNQLLLLLL